MQYNRSYHPWFAWGYVTVFAGIVMMAIATITGIIPLQLQPLFILVVVGSIIGGGIIGTIGYFKSMDSQAYPIIVIILIIPLIVIFVMLLTQL